MEKKLEKEKQSLRELKNKVTTSGPAGSGNQGKDQVLGGNSNNNTQEKKENIGLKQRSEGDRDQVRKRERKSLMKSLTLAQKSTASMGKFDKKVNKHEPDAIAKLKQAKKKSNAALNKIENSFNKGTAEKERSLKILGQMQKEKDYNAGGKVNANLNKDKMLKKHQKKDDKFRKHNSS